MRRYPVIEIRYTSTFTVSSQHNNMQSINSTREKCAVGVCVYRCNARFYAISHPEVKSHLHVKIDKFCKKQERDGVDHFLF